MKWRLRQWARIPFPLALDDSRSVLAVKGSLRRVPRPGPLRADPKKGCLRGKRGLISQFTQIYLAVLDLQI